MFQPASSTADVAERLAPFPFADRISEAGRQEIVRAARSIEAPRGAILVEEGQDCDPVVLVERGEIRVFKSLDGGREISLYRVHPGESCVLALSSLLSRTPYPATAAAGDDLRGLAVPADLFRRLYESEPPLQSFVMQLFSERLADLMQLVVEVAFKRMDQRLARYLLDRARVGDGVLRPVNRTHERVAQELGTSREVVTRVLQSFEKDGLVSLGRGQIAVQDAKGLEGWLD
jgi:CRP/FNR family transcriptional regulator